MKRSSIWHRSSKVFAFVCFVRLVFDVAHLACCDAELSVHTAVEERVVYPVLPAILEGTLSTKSIQACSQLDPFFLVVSAREDGHVMYEKVLADHQSQKQILKELEDLQVEGPEFQTRFNSLREVCFHLCLDCFASDTVFDLAQSVMAHVKETEEGNLLPRLDAALSPSVRQFIAA
jgi:hypothetical protein